MFANHALNNPWSGVEKKQEIASYFKFTNLTYPKIFRKDTNCSLFSVLTYQVTYVQVCQEF